MALDYRLPMMVEEPPQAKDPFQTMKEVMGVRTDQMKLQDLQEAKADEEALKAAYQQYGMDPKARPQILGAISPRNPILAEKLQQAWKDQDIKNRQGEQKIGQDNLAVLGVLAEAADFTAQSMISNPQANWGRGVRHLKTIAGIGKQIKVPQEVLDQIGALNEVPDDASMSFVQQIPVWAATMGKAKTGIQNLIEAFIRTNGREPNYTELMQIQKAYAETMRLQQPRPDMTPQAMMVPGPDGKPRPAFGVYSGTPEGGMVEVKGGAPIPTGRQYGVEGPLTIVATPPEPWEANEVVANTRITRQTAFETALDYLVMGPSSIPWSNRDPDPAAKESRNVVINTANAIIPDDTTKALLRSDYAALAAAEKAQVRNYLGTMPFIESIKLSVQQARSLSEQYPRYTIPKANEWKIWWDRNISGDPNLAELDVFIFNVARDYAKATSGSAQSVQQLTDASQKAAVALYNGAQNPVALEAAARSILQDAQNIRTTQLQSISAGRAGILRLLPGMTKGAPEDAGNLFTPAPRPAGSGGSLKRLDDLTIEVTVDGQPARRQFDTKAQADAAWEKANAQVGGPPPPPPPKVQWQYDPKTGAMTKVGG